MYNQIMREQEKQSNKIAAEREKILIQKVGEVIDVLKSSDLTAQEAMLVIENAKARLNSSVGSKKIAELI